MQSLHVCVRSYDTRLTPEGADGARRAASLTIHLNPAPEVRHTVRVRLAVVHVVLKPTARCYDHRCCWCLP